MEQGCTTAPWLAYVLTLCSRARSPAWWHATQAADDPGPVATFKPNSGTVRDVVFLPSGRSTPLVLSAGGGDCAIRCWHMHREPEPLSVLSGHSGVVFTVAPCSEDRVR